MAPTASIRPPFIAALGGFLIAGAFVFPLVEVPPDRDDVRLILWLTAEGWFWIGWILCGVAVIGGEWPRIQPRFGWNAEQLRNVVTMLLFALTNLAMLIIARDPDSGVYTIHFWGCALGAIATLLSPGAVRQMQRRSAPPTTD